MKTLRKFVASTIGESRVVLMNHLSPSPSGHPLHLQQEGGPQRGRLPRDPHHIRGLPRQE